jgi:hypothetical protein
LMKTRQGQSEKDTARPWRSMQTIGHGMMINIHAASTYVYISADKDNLPTLQPQPSGHAKYKCGKCGASGDRSPGQPKLRGHSQTLAHLSPSVWYPRRILRQCPDTPMLARSNFALFCTVLHISQRFAAIRTLSDDFVYILMSLDTFPDLDQHPHATSPQPSHISVTNN